MTSFAPFHKLSSTPKPLEVPSLVIVPLPHGGFATGNPLTHTIKVWDEEWTPVATLEGHSGAVNALGTSACGDIVSGSNDGSVKVWRDSACLHTCVGHSGQVLALAVSPVNDVFVSGSHDCTARVWSASTGECLATLEGHEAAVPTVCVLSNGDVLTGSEDRVRVWARGTWTSTAVHSFPSDVYGLSPMHDGFAAGGGEIFGGGGFVSVWSGGEEQWRLSTAGLVVKVVAAGGAVVACSFTRAVGVFEGRIIAHLEGPPATVAARSGGTFLAVGETECAVYRVVRPPRLAVIHTMVKAWEQHGGVPPPLIGTSTRGAVLARTLSLRRFCRRRGVTDVGRETEIVEPFGQAVAEFL